MPIVDYITIPLTRGHSTVIDKQDADLAALKWFAAETYPGRNYAQRTRPTTMLHKKIMERIIGRKISKDERVDHWDNDPLNNRRSNLRLASNTQNCCNAKLRKDSTTGYKGVSRRGNRYIAQIQANGKKIHIGMYDTPELAYAAYCEAAKKYHGEFARFE